MQVGVRVEAGERDQLDFAVFFLGVVFVGLEISDDQALDHGLRGAFAVLAFAREEHEFFHAARFQLAQRGSGDFAQVGDLKLGGLAGSENQQLFRRETLGKCSRTLSSILPVISPLAASSASLPFMARLISPNTPSNLSSLSKTKVTSASDSAEA